MLSPSQSTAPLRYALRSPGPGARGLNWFTSGPQTDLPTLAGWLQLVTEHLRFALQWVNVVDPSVGENPHTLTLHVNRESTANPGKPVAINLYDGVSFCAGSAGSTIQQALVKLLDQLAPGQPNFTGIRCQFVIAVVRGYLNTDTLLDLEVQASVGGAALNRLTAARQRYRQLLSGLADDTTA